MIVLRVLLLVVSVNTVIYNDEVIEDNRVRSLVKERKRYQKVRCSRRFTPGFCLDPVRPVWTFVAPQQTCMYVLKERLGCPSGVFTNRFNSYEDCRTMCSDLVYLFMYLQSLDNDTFRVPDEGLESSTRQANVDAMYSEIMQQDQIQEPGDAFNDGGNDNEDDYRRSLHEALSNLPEANPDYSVERPYEASDDRPPPPARRELIGHDDIIVPNIDRF